ncbi:4Fe-4S binding protein [Streptomyces sp. NPDC059468]
MPPSRSPTPWNDGSCTGCGACSTGCPPAAVTRHWPRCDRKWPS